MIRSKLCCSYKEYGIEPLKLQNPIDNLAHGTTCVAIRFKDGVILAGDRRATSGHHISHRTLDKVFSLIPTPELLFLEPQGLP